MDTIIMDEESMKWFIKDLLCLDSKGGWRSDNISSTVKIEFKGNCHNVQKEIYKWLNVPERKNNFNLLEGK